MCLTPITIPNKNKSKIICKKAKKLQDCESAYMDVPCGTCKQCVAMAQMELIERVQMEAMQNRIFMGTLTYKNETLPILQLPDYWDEDAVIQPGYKYRYADYHDASAVIKRMQNNNAYGIPFKYLIVTERGSLRARPHFHCLLLFSNKDLPTYQDIMDFEQTYKWTLLENWKRNVGTRNKPEYKNLCDYVESYRGGKKRATYDFHYVNPIYTAGGVTDAAFYVLKYMMKGKQNLDTKRALILNYEKGGEYWETIKDRREYSLGFGLNVDYSKQGKNRKITKEVCDEEIVHYLRSCVERSKQAKTAYAYYYCPENINTFPLADYYKKFSWIYNTEDEDYFYNLDPKKYREMKLMPEHKAVNEIIKQFTDFEAILKLQEMEDIADNFDELLNK